MTKEKSPVVQKLYNQVRKIRDDRDFIKAVVATARTEENCIAVSKLIEDTPNITDTDLMLFVISNYQSYNY